MEVRNDRITREEYSTNDRSNENIFKSFFFFFLKNGKQDSDEVPTPVVIVDQDSDPDATVVEVTFGDRLGALLDTVMKCSAY